MPKVCRDCDIEKDITDYNKDGRGYYYQPCKTCCQQRNLKWQQDNRVHLQQYQLIWANNNRTKVRQYRKNSIVRMKKLVFDYYGNKCACCGETEPKFLTIDHVYNDGFKHRKEIKGDKIYSHIIKEDYSDRFQILCWNCNMGKMLNGGVCPHKTLEGSTTIPNGSTPQATGGGSAELL